LKSPKTDDQLKISDGSFLTEAIALIPIPIVIIIDGLDRVSQYKYNLLNNLKILSG
jgi:hypothetical protein